MWCAAALGMLLLPDAGQSQEVSVRGRVTYNPLMSECLDQAICERDIELGLYPEEDWIPPTAAVNIAVKGTDRVVKTDRDGNYTVTVPSADASLMFMFIGYSRVEVPVAGRSRVDVKLTPTPLPVIERVLDVIMPQIHAMRTPDIDEVAREAGVNRETARDLIWLTLGNRPMARAYPGEYIPDYRFDDATE
jgi:hypothetical protein